MANKIESAYVKINTENCTNCGICRQVCSPANIGGFNSIEEVPKEYCMSCGHCVVACQNNAINHPAVTSSEPIGELPTSDQVINLIKKARSTRVFKSEQMKQKHFDKISEVLKYSQNGANSQKIDMIIINSKEIMNKLSASMITMFDMLKSETGPLSKFNTEQNSFVVNYIAETQPQRKYLFENGYDPILFNASALLLLIGPKDLATGKDDADIAAENITLLAPTLGLGTCYIGSISIADTFKYEPLLNIINLPDGYSIYQSLVIGYPKYPYKDVPKRNERNITFI